MPMTPVQPLAKTEWSECYRCCLWRHRGAEETDCWTILKDQGALFSWWQSGKCQAGSVSLHLVQSMEESRGMELRGELEQAYQILTKEAEDKMPFEGIEITKVLSRIPLLARYFDTSSEQFINLCIAQDAVELQEGQPVYSLEEVYPHRYLYVIFEGLVRVGGAVFGPLSTVGHVEIFHARQSRMNSPVAATYMRMMRIEESAMMRLFTGGSEVRKSLKFIQANSYFNGLAQMERMQLALCLSVRQFQRSQVLKEAGQTMSEVLFLVHGRVQVVARLENGKQFSIDSLEEFGSYGQFECVSGEGTDLELRGSVAGAYFSVRYSQIQALKHSILPIMAEKALPYPSFEELCFLEKVKSTTQKEQKRIEKKLGLKTRI